MLQHHLPDESRKRLLRSMVLASSMVVIGLVTASSTFAQSFGAPTNYVVGNHPYASALGDFNGDGRLDLAVANNEPKNVSVLLRNPDGTFGSKTDYDVGASAYGIVVVDLNNDGKLDIVTDNSFSLTTNVSVLLGNGNGTFQTKVDYSFNGLAQPNSILSADFNGDNKPDFVAVNTSGASVFLGNGDGTLQSAVSYGSSNFATSVAVGDFNTDGKFDLAVSSYGFGPNGVVSIMLGTGSGTFLPAVNYASAPSPFSITTRDFNGDSKLDLVTANIQVDSVSVLLGNGDGSFAAPVNYPAGTNLYYLTTGDFNGDGKLDLLNALNGGGLSILDGNGDGTFLAPIRFQAGGVFATVVDLNGDTKPDLVTGGSVNSVSVLLNQTGPHVISGVIKDANAVNLSGVTIFLTGGATQVATTDTSGAYAFRDLPTSSNFTVQPFKTNYTFAPPTQVFNNLSSSVTADFVGTLATYSISGKVRESFTNPIAGVVMTLSGSQSGTVSTAADGSYSFTSLPGGGNYTVTPSYPKFTFTPPFSISNNLSSNRVVNFTGNVATYSISGIVADLNNGQSLDNITLLLSGARTATATTSFSGYSFTGLPVDGNYTVTAYGSALTSLFTNLLLVPPVSQTFNGLASNQTANFTARRLSFDSSNADPRNIAKGDLNGDAKLDLIVSNAIAGRIDVLIGNGDGSFKTEVTYPAASNSGAAAVGDFDVDGKLDVASAGFGGDVSVFIGNGDGTLKPQVRYPAGFQNSSISIGDLNGDSKIDLAVLGSNNTLSILLGIGDGTFQAAVNRNIPTAVGNVSIGDLNGDTKPDLVVLGYPDSILVLIGNGNGTFANPVTYAAGTNAIKGAIADINADGKLDVAVNRNNGFTILLGNGDGTFQPALLTSLTTNTSYITVEDFDGDAKLDLVIANYNGGFYFVSGNGDGTFKPQTFYQAGAYPEASVAGDFNNDGKPDLAFSNQGGPPVFVLLNTSLSHAPGLQFNSSAYNVNEGNQSAVITVTRSGDLSGTATVDYSTADGTARQRIDYTSAFGTLTFAAGEATKTFRVIIADNNYVDGSRTVALTLSNPNGAVTATPASATLTIADNDTTPPATNPLDDAQFFVRQHYSDFLSRLPDQGGLDYWVGQITQCGIDQNCIRTKRVDVSNAFFYELEYQQTGSYVYRLFRAAFGNNQPFPNTNPDPTHPNEEKKVPSYAAFSPDRARVKGGAGLADSQLARANALVQRTEFMTRYSPALDGPAFVDAIIATIRNDIGVDLISQRNALIALFNHGGRGEVIYRLADDNVGTNPINNRAFIDAEYNRAFVVTQYFGYLRRNPDMAGFLFWLGQVDAAPLRDVGRQHAMVCSFITSTEYQQRFSSTVTHSNSECPQ